MIGTSNVNRFGHKVTQTRQRWYGHVNNRGDECVGRKILGFQLPGKRTSLAEAYGGSAVATPGGKALRMVTGRHSGPTLQWRRLFLVLS